MGQIQATCGHEISVEWAFGGQSDITTKAFTREGYRATSYQTVCPACKEFYTKEKLILYTKQEEYAWLRIKRTRNGKRPKAKRVLET